MTETYNVYRDESAQQEHDHQRAMVIGAIWCPIDKVREINLAHGKPADFEAE